jgi:hypothetical protein
MNLLPYAFRRRLLVRKLLGRWGLVWTVCGLVGGAVCGWAWSDLRSAQAELAGIEETTRPVREMAEENRRFIAQIEEISGRESVLNELGGIAQPVSLLALISQSARFADERLQIQRMNVAQVVREPESGSGQKPGPQKGKPSPGDAAPRKTLELTLSGVARDDVAVSRFVSALRDQGVFETVELRSSVGVRWAHGEGRRYDVVCRR